jgi:2-oxoglutarate dehydrogenase E1 component
MADRQQFHSLNLPYIAQFFDQTLQTEPLDPVILEIILGQEIPSREVPGQELPPKDAGVPLPLEKIIRAVNLAQAIRTYGHLAARLDPLGSDPPGDPLLDLAAYDLTEQDLEQMPAVLIGVDVEVEAANALEAVWYLRTIYCQSVGYDYGHIRVPQERQWLRKAAEHGLFRPPTIPVDERALLDRLTQVEGFEQFLHRFFPGKTRFSIEGVDMLVPMMDELVHAAVDKAICAVMIGMAHRGRLNVLAHNLAKPYAQILAEFKDPNRKYLNLDETGWLGDVKYHSGADHAVMGDEWIRTILRLAPNPSHLEHVDPVVEGMARSAASGVSNPGAPEFFPQAAMPVLIHGDASFPAQGVVAETLNFSRLEGYRTSGTIHIIANNQLGFTTSPTDGRSTLYSSDLAKGFEIPIMHVNADDPVACFEAIRTAFAYRQEFYKDFLVDLVGYRRYGHNEGDEPGFTQPRLYQVISRHPSVRAQLAARLVEEGTVEPDYPDLRVQAVMIDLQSILEKLEPEHEIDMPAMTDGKTGESFGEGTAVSFDHLIDLHNSLHTIPEGFQINPKLGRAMKRRRSLGDDPLAARVDWSTAEQLAFASILSEGTPIRLTGQDVERGTFSQRHAVFFDVRTSEAYVPLQSLPQSKASFEIHNSPLSENAALGFEYGYSIMDPGRMVIWEAQYGDFINSAQAMIDEFLVSGRSKWDQKTGLVLLLPHGYEGQGPDHSSGRPERFLQMAAGENLRLVNCTTAAQYFHVLRAHAVRLKTQPLPMVIFTPKSLLRHPKVASPVRDFVEGRWHAVLDDPFEGLTPQEVSRILLCSGKVAIDLLENRDHEAEKDLQTAIIRLEQIYPFPASQLRQILDRYPNVSEIAWVQEEPENMGAWFFVRQSLEDFLQGRLPICYFGRITSPSPAEGSFTWHQSNQQAIVSHAIKVTSHGGNSERKLVVKP